MDQQAVLGEGQALQQQYAEQRWQSLEERGVLTGQHQGPRWEAAGMSVPKVPLVSAQLLPGQKLLMLRQ